MIGCVVPLLLLLISVFMLGLVIASDPLPSILVVVAFLVMPALSVRWRRRPARTAPGRP